MYEHQSEHSLLLVPYVQIWAPCTGTGTSTSTGREVVLRHYARCISARCIYFLTRC